MATSTDSDADGEYADFGQRPDRTDWVPYPGAEELARQLLKSRPGGVDGILIGLLKVPGFQIVEGSNGIIAILIGLLLPAVQKVRATGSGERRILAGALKPSGGILFAMGDGSVRVAPSSQFRPRDDRWIAALGANWGIVSPRDAASGLPTGKRIY